MIPTSILKELKNTGLLDKCLKYGVINYKVFMMLPIREKIDALMRQGKSHGEAVRHIADEMRMSTRNVYNYL